MDLLHLLLIYISAIFSVYSDEIYSDNKDKPVNLDDNGFNENSQALVDWPPAMLRDTSDGDWKKGTFGRHVKVWPNMVPWAQKKSDPAIAPYKGTLNAYNRKTHRKRNSGDDYMIQGLINVDPEYFRKKYKFAIPKIRNNRGTKKSDWPYSFY